MEKNIAPEEETLTETNNANSDEQEETSEESIVDKSEFLDLYLGEDLSAEECKSITSSAMTKVIVLAGEVDSGKTTLLASIYEHFLKGPYANFLFSGSKTLIAFERVCHDARLASKRQKATTPRTPHKGEFRFLHLKVQDITSKTLQDILITDVSGEMYREIRDSSEECKKHHIFSRADHFVLLIDGKKICNPISRGKSINDATQLLRQCIDSSMLNSKSIVDVVFTKTDHLTVAFNKNAKLKEAVEKMIKDKFVENLMKKIPNMSFHKIAARVNNKLKSGIEKGFGVVPLFNSWIQDSPSTRNTIDRAVIESNISSREIDKFHNRYFKQA